ncbi:glycoside hydrolase family 3 protein [Vibrio palustris]|uniref:beta-glucosidase n=1 Tax=Vibrio palustris TaxID=1918946 RepID=A0A1R4B630_9VIBR|nr:glycoside hydrolase family 3 N-terminal domain-containing protein [Vibrio palustris]SJL84380.1 Periplasmic beta-glucosidase precursor [Vibrio palustris]
MLKHTLLAFPLAILPLSVLAATQQPTLTKHHVPLLTVDNHQFKDLNRDGVLNPYEDWRLSDEQRAKDLVSRMTLEQKAGAMMHASAPSPTSVLGRGPVYDLKQLKTMIQTDHVNAMITRLDGDNPQRFAEQNNALQALAEETSLGIPVTISTDPRNAYHYSTHDDIDSAAAGKFSQWPQSPGFGAINDKKLTRQYADILRQEYRAVGITEALSPQADIASEPRWARIQGTFGEDPQIVHDMVESYVEGMQNGRSGLNAGSVITVVKHWVGYGAAKDGWDSHSAYGKYADFEDNNLDQHIYPFKGAFDAHVASVMPTYSILKGVKVNGKDIEQVGAGFSHYLLTDLLRDTYHFDGVILSDWLITADCNKSCIDGAPKGKAGRPEDLGMSWGVGDLSIQQRFVKAVKAGVDQFGGVADPTPIVSAVNQGDLSQDDIDHAVVKIMKQKFATGLFEAPFVDPDKASERLGAPKNQALADEAQARSVVLLKNQDDTLPLKSGTNVFLYHMEPSAAQAAGLNVVDSLDQADVALLRVSSPYSHPHPNYFFGVLQHEGPLTFAQDSDDYRMIQKASKAVPTIVNIYLDRPTVLKQINDQSAAILANFGANDTVLFNAMTGHHAITGHLPFEMPRSMQAAKEQHSDLPHDSKNPLYPIGFGMSL